MDSSGWQCCLSLLLHSFFGEGTLLLLVFSLLVFFLLLLLVHLKEGGDNRVSVQFSVEHSGNNHVTHRCRVPPVLALRDIWRAGRGHPPALGGAVVPVGAGVERAG